MNEIHIIKEDERQKITLMYDANANKRYIQRRTYDDKRDIYKSLEKINHPNIPKIFGVDFDSDTVVTEEYIEGESLRQLMDEGKVFSKRQIKSIAKQVVSAMAELHGCNIIHRDIKPDNIIMNKAGHIWLIDYDIARIWRGDIRKDTESRGTFGYAPIEQFGMMPTDFKTDIYAFGVTLSELLVRSGIKGSLLKIAEKCKKLDPAERYQTAQKIESAINLSGKLKVAFVAVVMIAVVALAFILQNTIFKEVPVTKADIANSKYDVDERKDENVEVDEELLAIINFEGFELSEHERQFRNSQFYETADIFAVDDVWAHLSFIEDTEKSGIIYMGKGKETDVKAEIELKDGVLSVELEDPYGHSFSGDFEYNPDIPYTLTYTEDRRRNAELICRDIDGDFIEELLIGVNDCSFKMTDSKVLCYFNYSQAWCVKYDESRGFTLCDGEMFSDNGKFAFVTNDLRVHLPVYAIRKDDRCGYELKGNKIIPFY